MYEDDFLKGQYEDIHYLDDYDDDDRYDEDVDVNKPEVCEHDTIHGDMCLTALPSYGPCRNEHLHYCDDGAYLVG